MISSQYGWTDEEILNLTFSRFRQIVASIERRRYLEYRQQMTIASWQTRVLATYIAQGYMLAEGSENTPLELASKLAIDEIEKAQLEEHELEEIDKPIEDRVQPGSYEKLTSALSRMK